MYIYIYVQYVHLLVVRWWYIYIFLLDLVCKQKQIWKNDLADAAVLILNQAMYVYVHTRVYTGTEWFSATCTVYIGI